MSIPWGDKKVVPVNQPPKEKYAVGKSKKARPTYSNKPISSQPVIHTIEQIFRFLGTFPTLETLLTIDMDHLSFKQKSTIRFIYKPKVNVFIKAIIVILIAKQFESNQFTNNTMLNLDRP